MQIIKNLIAKYKGYMMLGLLIVFILLGAYAKYLHYRLEIEKEARIEAESNLELAIKEYENQLKIERVKTKFETSNLKAKEEITKQSEKVKQESIKRGEIEAIKDDFCVVSF